MNGTLFISPIAVALGCIRLVLAERRSGYVIILLGSLLGSGVPVVHMMGSGLVGGKIADSSGVFFWVWTNIALGVTASFSVILSAHGLWSLRGKSRSSSNPNMEGSA